MSKDSHTPETEVVKKIYADLNAGRIADLMKYFDADVERIEPVEFESPDNCHGLVALEKHFHKGRGNWVEGGCEAERFFVYGDKVLVFVHVKVKLKSTLQWVEGDLSDVFTFRAGKVVEFQTFVDRVSALRFAGIRI